jgi:hypothetical protein
LVEKSLSPPRVGPVGLEAACCWVSAMKALPWSMSIHPLWLLMSMETGVDGGSALVPEVVWLSSDSMRVVGGFIMLGCIMLLGMFMVMPGASGMFGCGFWAMRDRGDDRTSERKIAGRMRGMTVFLLRARWRLMARGCADAAGGCGSGGNQMRSGVRGGKGGASAK